MNEKITISEIEKLEQLSALKFSMSDKQNLINELDNIVKMINECGRVNTDRVKSGNCISLENLRDDICRDGFTAEQALANAPKTSQGYFSVPKAVE